MKKIYYISTEVSPIKRDFFSISINGCNKTQLTDGKGVYTIKASKKIHYYLSFFSNFETPNYVTLHEENGKLVRVLEDNHSLKELIAKRKIPVKEFFEFETSQGTKLYGYKIVPNDFDPKTKYPLLLYQYSGPHGQFVIDRWELSFLYLIVEKGIIVGCVDGRGTSNREDKFVKCTYKQLGKLETEDQIETAKYFCSLGYIDCNRIGIYGWSFGGFISLNCILVSDKFKLAASVAPVTSWRFYDTIYTERYMSTPEKNQEGYSYAPLNHCEKINGKLFIVHGTSDDNVHIQNSYELINKLVQNNQHFDMFIYSEQNHQMASVYFHLLSRLIQFITENL